MDESSIDSTASDDRKRAENESYQSLRREILSLLRNPRDHGMAETFGGLQDILRRSEDPSSVRLVQADTQVGHCLDGQMVLVSVIRRIPSLLLSYELLSLDDISRQGPCAVRDEDGGACRQLRVLMDQIHTQPTGLGIPTLQDAPIFHANGSHHPLLVLIRRWSSVLEGSQLEHPRCPEVCGPQPIYALANDVYVLAMLNQAGDWISATHHTSRLEEEITQYANKCSRLSVAGQVSSRIARRFNSIVLQVTGLHQNFDEVSNSSIYSASAVITGTGFRASIRSLPGPVAESLIIGVEYIMLNISICRPVDSGLNAHFVIEAQPTTYVVQSRRLPDQTTVIVDVQSELFGLLYHKSPNNCTSPLSAHTDVSPTRNSLSTDVSSVLHARILNELQHAQVFRATSVEDEKKEFLIDLTCSNVSILMLPHFTLLLPDTACVRVYITDLLWTSSSGILGEGELPRMTPTRTSLCSISAQWSMSEESVLYRLRPEAPHPDTLVLPIENTTSMCHRCPPLLGAFFARSNDQQPSGEVEPPVAVSNSSAWMRWLTGVPSSEPNSTPLSLMHASPLWRDVPQQVYQGAIEFNFHPVPTTSARSTMASKLRAAAITSVGTLGMAAIPFLGKTIGLYQILLPLTRSTSLSALLLSMLKQEELISARRDHIFLTNVPIPIQQLKRLLVTRYAQANQSEDAWGTDALEHAQTRELFQIQEAFPISRSRLTDLSAFQLILMPKRQASQPSSQQESLNDLSIVIMGVLYHQSMREDRFTVTLVDASGELQLELQHDVNSTMNSPSDTLLLHPGVMPLPTLGAILRSRARASTSQQDLFPALVAVRLRPNRLYEQLISSQTGELSMLRVGSTFIIRPEAELNRILCTGDMTYTLSTDDIYVLSGPKGYDWRPRNAHSGTSIKPYLQATIECMRSRAPSRAKEPHVSKAAISFFAQERCAQTLAPNFSAYVRALSTAFVRFELICPECGQIAIRNLHLDLEEPYVLQCAACRWPNDADPVGAHIPFRIEGTPLVLVGSRRVLYKREAVLEVLTHGLEVGVEEVAEIREYTNVRRPWILRSFAVVNVTPVHEDVATYVPDFFEASSATSGITVSILLNLPHYAWTHLIAPLLWKGQTASLASPKCIIEYSRIGFDKAFRYLSGLVKNPKPNSPALPTTSAALAHIAPSLKHCAAQLIDLFSLIRRHEDAFHGKLVYRTQPPPLPVSSYSEIKLDPATLREASALPQVLHATRVSRQEVLSRAAELFTSCIERARSEEEVRISCPSATTVAATSSAQSTQGVIDREKSQATMAAVVGQKRGVDR